MASEKPERWVIAASYNAPLSINSRHCANERNRIAIHMRRRFQSLAEWSDFTFAERALCVVLLLNAVTGLVLGGVYGTPEFGKVDHGHYYLSNHGKYVEVSRLHRRLSCAQTPSIIPSLIFFTLINVRAVRRRSKQKS